MRAGSQTIFQFESLSARFKSKCIYLQKLQRHNNFMSIECSDTQFESRQRKETTEKENIKYCRVFIYNIPTTKAE